MSLAPPSFCPYRGLLPYTAEAQPYFFGRARSTRVIAANLKANPLTVLYGASGVGKTSALLAGVMPSLNSTAGTAVVAFRDWQSPVFLENLKARCVAAVKRTLSKELQLASEASPFDVLLEALAESLGAPLLIILDQFEEFFLYNPNGSDERSFDAELARAINRASPCAKFLLSMREDSLARLDRFSKRIPNLLANTLPLEHLDLESAREAIEKPLEIFNRQFEDEPDVSIEGELISTVLEEVKTSVNESGESGARIEAPILQLVMSKLWLLERKSGSQTLRAATMDSLKGARTIVKTHLDEVLDALPVEDQALCSELFDRLVTPSGSKIAYDVTDLQRTAGERASRVEPIVKQLSSEHARVLRVLPGPPAAPERKLVEILHDVLAPAILDWRTRFVQKQELVEAARQAQLKAAQAAETARRDAALLQAELLAKIQREKSVALAKAVKQLRVLAIVATGFLAGALVLAYFLKRQQDEAEAQTTLLFNRSTALSNANAQNETKAALLTSERAAEQQAANEAVAANKRILDGVLLRQAFWSANIAEINRRLTTATEQDPIRFEAKTQALGFKDERGRDEYGYLLSPVESSVRGGFKSLAGVTFLVDNANFRNSLLTAGANRRFTSTYNSYACLGTIQTYALIEYQDPNQEPTVHAFNMCGILRSIAPRSAH